MSIFGDLTNITIYFSKSLGIPVIDAFGNNVGKVTDFFVDFEEVYPQVFALQLKKKNKSFYIYWKEIKSFSFKKILLNEKVIIREGNVCPKSSEEDESPNILKSQYKQKVFKYPPLGKVILDKQIVDTFGKKVVRVNDLQFIKSGPHLRVTHVAVGIRSIIRRLGFEKFIDFFIKKNL